MARRGSIIALPGNPFNVFVVTDIDGGIHYVQAQRVTVDGEWAFLWINEEVVHAFRGPWSVLAKELITSQEVETT